MKKLHNTDYVIYQDNDVVRFTNNEIVLYGDKEEALYDNKRGIVMSCTELPNHLQEEILNQIQSDLAELQNNPNGLSYDELIKFYDRVCSNITDYENNI